MQNECTLILCVCSSTSLAASCSSLRVRQTKCQPRAPHGSGTSIHLIRKKRRLYLQLKRKYSASLLTEYKQLRNKVRCLTRLETRKYSESLSNQYVSNPRKFWSWINSSKGRRNPIPPLRSDGCSVIDDSSKADVFNKYFQSVFTIEDTSDIDSLREHLIFNDSIISEIEFSASIVFEYLSNLDVTKACGPDLLPAFLLKHCAEAISAPLAYLFNRSMSTGTLPHDWVSANIVPVFKRGDKHNPGNYRPISLTSVVIKTMERIIHSQLVLILQQNNLLQNHQYGFRRSHSTTHLLLEATHDWALSLEARGSSHCLFLDFTKAFDTVPHHRLLLKLRALGITGNLLQWIQSFLTSRLQRVVVNGHHSKWLSVSSGVPQGSILGPLFFILYVNDVSSVVKHSSIKMFADDLTLYRDVASVDDCCLLQQDLSQVYEWTVRWLLRLHPGKCEAITLTNKRSPITFSYSIGLHSVSWVKQVKYLGLYVTPKLDWSLQCKHAASRATACLNRLRRVMYGSSPIAKAIAYKSLIRPHLEYACQVWSPYTNKNINLLESVQRRASRWICSKWNPLLCTWTKSSDECIAKLKWPTLEKRRQYLSIVTAHNIIRHLTCIRPSNYFRFNTTVTRAHPLTLNLPTSTINAFRYSFFVSVCFLWNGIPEAILAAECVTNRLRRHLLTV